MIKVYQIVLTTAELDALNRDETSPKIKAYFDRSFERTFKAENFEHYTHVANVDLDNMDLAFRAMNLWQADENFDRIERFAGVPCSSMSVGDILELEDGTRHRVASWGFTAI